MGSDGEGGSWGVMEGVWSGVMEGGEMMGNDGGGRQWWGFMEGEGVVCWASHFVRGPSIFIHTQSFSLVHGRLRSCTVVLICGRSSLSFEQAWWMVLAGRLSGCLSGVVVSVGARHSWVGLLLSMGGASSMGSHHYLGLGMVICGWGIIVCGWGIAFCGWGSSLSVDGGAHRLLWFECHGGWFAWVVGMVWGFTWCGGLHGWWGFAWV